MKITEEQVIRWKSTGATTVRVFYDGLKECEKHKDCEDCQGCGDTEEELPCNDQLVGLEVLEAWPVPYFKKKLVAGHTVDEVKKIIREFVQNHPDMRKEVSYETMIYRALSGDMKGIKYDAYNFMSKEYIESSQEDGDDGFDDMFYMDIGVAILGYDPDTLAWGTEEWKQAEGIAFEFCGMEEDEEYDEE